MSTTTDTLPPAVAKAEAARAATLAALEGHRQGLAAARAAVITALDTGDRAQVAKAEQVVKDMEIDDRIKQRAVERAEEGLLAARRGALDTRGSGLLKEAGTLIGKGVPQLVAAVSTAGLAYTRALDDLRRGFRRLGDIERDLQQLDAAAAEQGLALETPWATRYNEELPHDRLAERDARGDRPVDPSATGAVVIDGRGRPLWSGGRPTPLGAEEMGGGES